MQNPIMDTETSPHLISLEDCIQVLTDLYNRLQILRQIPSQLLKIPHVGVLPTPASPQREFQRLKDLHESLCSDKVQDALRMSRDSEKADASGLSISFRRENMKRRRPLSPESPQPYISIPRKSTSLFPIRDSNLPPLRVNDLADFIRQFNRSNKCKLHIWMRERPPPERLSSPVVVRFTIKDVLVVYISLTHNLDEPVLVIESTSAFGPRENKAPHAKSEYLVYQNLSQQISKMVQSYPDVSLQNLIDLLVSYEGVFVDRCTNCQRVLSAEGHVPPVSRIWIDPSSEGEKGKWDPRHVTCSYA